MTLVACTAIVAVLSVAAFTWWLKHRGKRAMRTARPHCRACAWVDHPASSAGQRDDFERWASEKPRGGTDREDA